MKHRRCVLGAVAALLLFMLGTAAGQSNVTGISGFYRDGQVFLTWNEINGTNVRYRVYRAATAIQTPADVMQADFLGEVDDGTSRNQRESQLVGSDVYYSIFDLGLPLSATTGLFVHTCQVFGPGFYAVRPVVNGVETTTVTAGDNASTVPLLESVAPPRPVLQSARVPLFDFAHWVSDRATPVTPALWYEPSRAFNLRIIYDPGASPGLRPVLLRFHGRTQNNKFMPEQNHAEAVVVAPDDWFPDLPFTTYWFGMNSNFPDTMSYTSGVTHDYTIRRVMLELDFALQSFPTDPDRVYVRGFSAGGFAAHYVAYKFPDRFAAAQSISPKFDFACNQSGCWIEPFVGSLLWGDPADNIPTSEGVPTYDELDIAHHATSRSADVLPFVSTIGGRADFVVGWEEKPPTFAAIESGRHGAAIYWDQGVHTGPGASSDGVWAPVLENHRLQLFNFRSSQAFPALGHLSLNDDPGNGNPSVGDPVGTLNGYVDWDFITIQDTASLHAVTCFLKTGGLPDAAPAATGTVDWTPRRLQQLQLQPDEFVRFRNVQLPAGDVIEHRLERVAADGVLTIPQTTVTTGRNRFIVEKLPLARPYLTTTGFAEIGETMDVHILGDPGAVAVLFYGFLPTSQAVPPPLTGTLQIGDPMLAGTFIVGPDGKATLPVPFGQAQLPLVGITFLMQSLVGFDLSNRVSVTVGP